MGAPGRLRTELLVDPLGLDTTAPRFSWLPCVEQSAYRIVVSGDAEWDSGRVSSGESLHVPYGGDPLPPLAQCTWRVRVWDADGGESDWSEPARFGVGPIGPGWSTSRELGPAPAPDEHFEPPSEPIAYWIGLGLDVPFREDESGPCPLLRREFELAGAPVRATAYASALGVYELRLNGERVGDSVLAPEWTSYRKRVQYQAYDVTASLRGGRNAVAATLAPGWYAGRLGLAQLAPGGARRGIYGRHVRFLLRLEIELEDGRVTIVTDDGWRVSADGPVRASDLLDGEHVDLRAEPDGWDRPGFDDSGWASAFATEYGPRLAAQPNEPIRVTEELRAASVAEVAPGVHLFDLGQEIAGWCRLRARGAAGAEVVLRHGEAVGPDGRLYRDNLRLPPVTARGAEQEDRFVLRGEEDVLEPRFTYHGFRYVEAAGLDSPRADDLVGCAVHSDAPRAGSFECSSELVNRIVRAIEWTLRDNLHSVPTDCPQRDERVGWTGDIQVFAPTAAYTLQMGPFFRKWLRDLRDDQADDGRFGDFAPHPYDPNRHFSGNPGWADAGLFVPWVAWMHYADRDLLAEHFDAARRFVDFVDRANPEHLWLRERGRPLQYGDWLNGDTLRLEGWPPQGANVPFDLYSSAFFARSTELLARMAHVLERDGDAARYGALAAAIRDAFAREFVAADGRVAGGTQAGYALALDFELVPEELRPAAAAHMVAALERYEGRISTGFMTTVRLMLQLARFGYLEQAYRLLLETAIPSWGYMVEHGATTIWERWDGYVEGRGFQDPRMNSLCHYAIGAVGEWIWRVVAGLEPDESAPGWRRFAVRPQPGGGLEWARASLETVRGTIRSEWSRADGRLDLRVSVPPGTRATVAVPGGDVVELGAGDHELEGRA